MVIISNFIIIFIHLVKECLSLAGTSLKIALKEDKNFFLNGER